MLTMIRSTHRPIPVRMPTLEDRIDAILQEWAEYRASYKLAAGHRSTSPGADAYQTPTHWDSRNGAADDRAEHLRIRGICEALEAVPDSPHRWRTSLEYRARNLHAQATVWSSLRLPNGEEGEVLLLEARNLFVKELRRRGIEV